MVSFSKIGLAVAGSPLSFLDNPIDVFVDKNNVIYVLETKKDRVQVWHPNATSGITIINGSYGTEQDRWKYCKLIEK